MWLKRIIKIASFAALYSALFAVIEHGCWTKLEGACGILFGLTHAHAAILIALIPPLNDFMYSSTLESNPIYFYLLFGVVNIVLVTTILSLTLFFYSKFSAKRS